MTYTAYDVQGNTARCKFRLFVIRKYIYIYDTVFIVYSNLKIITNDLCTIYLYIFA